MALHVCFVAASSECRHLQILVVTASPCPWRLYAYDQDTIKSGYQPSNDGTLPETQEQLQNRLSPKTQQIEAVHRKHRGRINNCRCQMNAGCPAAEASQLQIVQQDACASKGASAYVCVKKMHSVANYIARPAVDSLCDRHNRLTVTFGVA